jgi:hypothetical protein
VEESYASLRDSISHIKNTGLVDPMVTPEVAAKVMDLKLSAVYLLHIIGKPSYYPLIL